MAGGRAGTMMLLPLFESQVQDEDVKREQEGDADKRKDGNTNSYASCVEAIEHLMVQGKKDGRLRKQRQRGIGKHGYKHCGSTSNKKKKRYWKKQRKNIN